jgi:hypothetical protein
MSAQVSRSQPALHLHIHMHYYNALRSGELISLQNVLILYDASVTETSAYLNVTSVDSANYYLSRSQFIGQ